MPMNERHIESNHPLGAEPGTELSAPAGLSRRELMKLAASVGAGSMLSAGGAAAIATPADPPHVVYDNHVVFDNSPSDGGFDASAGYAVGSSTLELVNGRCPVDFEHFVSPPNGLRLKWRSAPGGDWRMTLKVRHRYGRPHKFKGNTLYFWCLPE